MNSVQYAVRSVIACGRMRGVNRLPCGRASTECLGPTLPLASSVSQLRPIHTGDCNRAWAKDELPNKWLTYNKKIFPPQSPDEERRLAYVCHMKTNIKYSPWKMWYIANMVRGMTVDEAVKQLSFVLKKGAAMVKEALLEAQELAVTQHNVEFKSNLWVAESFVGKGKVIKGVRRHARSRVGKVEYFHCHYFVRLEEGTPPANYYAHSAPQTGQEMLDKWLQQMRSRKVTSSL